MIRYPPSRDAPSLAHPRQHDRIRIEKRLGIDYGA
jgi:hypothetical protein